jgi:hypothetical protein
VRDDLYPADDVAAAPFKCRRIRLAPRESTRPHHHHDVELWIMVVGRGRVTMDGAERRLVWELFSLERQQTHANFTKYVSYSCNFRRIQYHVPSFSRNRGCRSSSFYVTGE